MRILLIGVVLFVQSLEAQQPKRPQPTFVKRQHDARADSVVRLLGEDSASKRDRLRLLDENVRVCTSATVTDALGKRASIAADARVGGFIAIPAAWTSEPLPAMSESVTGESTRLVARVSGKPAAGFGKRTQVYI